MRLRFSKQIDQCADKGDALQPVGWQMQEVQVPLVHRVRLILSQWLQVVGRGTKQPGRERQATGQVTQPVVSINGCTSWSVSPGWEISCRINLRKPCWAAGRLASVSEPSVDCELSSSTQSSSRKRMLGLRFGRTSLLKKKERKRLYRETEMSAFVLHRFKKLYKEPCKTKRVYLENDHMD